MAIEYRFCPICATPLQSVHRFDRVRPVCPACGFIHFADPKVAVIALVAVDGEVLLVRRAVDPGKGLWSLPGGYMDAGEMPAEALQREVAEEVGLTIRIGAMLDVFPMENLMENGDSQRVGIVLAYGAQPTDRRQTVHAQDDVSEAGWFAPTALPSELAFDSTKTLIAEWADNTKRTIQKRMGSEQ
ncbi:MAG: NUDIX hydrolase [Caldilineaceae bacterium]|nr:NUDIX hydrolase [Caldilineaceae bacterium]